MWGFLREVRGLNSEALNVKAGTLTYSEMLGFLWIVAQLFEPKRMQTLLSEDNDMKKSILKQTEELFRLALRNQENRERSQLASLEKERAFHKWCGEKLADTMGDKFSGFAEEFHQMYADKELREIFIEPGDGHKALARHKAAKLAQDKTE